jgi:hypothetical protein
MSRIALTLLALALSTGCRRGFPYQVALPTGGYAWSVECDVYNRCLQKIGDVCERGYRLLDEQKTQEDSAHFVKAGEYAELRARRGDVISILFLCR